MNSPIVAPAMAGAVLGQLGSDFVIAEWKDAGGPPGPPRWIAPLHLHRRLVDFLGVLGIGTRALLGGIFGLQSHRRGDQRGEGKKEKGDVGEFHGFFV